MKNYYGQKVALTRLGFLLGLGGCYLLYVYAQIDYLIMLILLILFVGIFSRSVVYIEFHVVVLQKHYFWNVIAFKKRIPFSSIISVSKNEHSVEALQDSTVLDEGSWSLLLFSKNIPSKIEWVKSILYYNDDGNEKSIELDISREDFWTLERKTEKSAFKRALDLRH